MASFICRDCVRSVLFSSLFAAGTAQLEGAIVMNLNVAATSLNGGAPTFAAFPGLEDTLFGREGEVTSFLQVDSPGSFHIGYLNHPLGNGSESGSWNSHQELQSALTGTWSLFERSVDGSESTYSFDLDLGSLFSDGLPVPTVFIPSSQSPINPQAPLFRWSSTPGYSLQLASLYELNDADKPIVPPVAVQFFGSAAVGTWTPGVTLKPGSRYEFAILQQAAVSFDGNWDQPTDSTGTPFAHDFSVTATMQGSSSMKFTAEFTEVPEPATVAGATLVLAWAGWRWQSRRKTRRA